LSNKIKIGRKKKPNKKKEIPIPEEVGKDKYFERHNYKAPEVKVTNLNYRGKI
jgi:hypothetical protein